MESTLFLGILIDQKIEDSLKKVETEILQLFICDDEMYLQKVQIEGKTFVGKILSPVIEISRFDALKKNIISIFEKIIPGFPLNAYSFFLLSLNANKNFSNV